MASSEDASDAASNSNAAPDLETTAEALSACIREALERGATAQVPGMGTFRVHHEPSQMQEQDDGTYAVIPPRDVVAFDPADA